MEKGVMGDKRKTIISIVVVGLVMVALILCLVFFTNIFSSDEKSVAQIRKIEKNLEQIEIPEIPEAEFIVEEEEVPSSKTPGPPPPPPAPNMGDYENIAHSIYPAFAKAYNLSIKNGILIASDDIVYNTAYYSVNGSNWTELTLQGDPYQDYPWVLDYGRINLPSELNGDGTHYVIIYSCSLNNDTWNCHGDIEDSVYVPKWQLRIVQNESSFLNLSEVITLSQAYDICNKDFCTTEEVWVRGNLSRDAANLGRLVLFDENNHENPIYININEEGILSEELTALHDEYKVHKDGVVEVRVKGTLENNFGFCDSWRCVYLVDMDIDVESMEFIREVKCGQEDFFTDNNLGSMACFNDSFMNLTRAYEIFINSTVCTDDGRTPSGEVFYKYLDGYWTFQMKSNSSSERFTKYCDVYENETVFERTEDCFIYSDENKTDCESYNDDNETDCESWFFWSSLEKKCICLDENIFVAPVMGIDEDSIDVVFGDIAARFELSSELREKVYEWDVIEAEYLGDSHYTGGEIVRLDVLERSCPEY